MHALIVVTAGGLARETLAVIDRCGRFGPVVVVDDDPDLRGSRVAGRPVVGGLDAVEERPDHLVVVCAGRGRVRRRIVERLARVGVTPDRYASVVDPGIRVPDGCTVGAGSILLAGVVLTADVHLGAHVVVMPNVSLTHDDAVADYATLCAGVALGGRVRIEEGAYLGMNACVRQDVRVGRDAVLGMGAVLVEDLPAGVTWAGVPARPISASRLRAGA